MTGPATLLLAFQNRPNRNWSKLSVNQIERSSGKSKDRPISTWHPRIGQNNTGQTWPESKRTVLWKIKGPATLGLVSGRIQFHNSLKVYDVCLSVRFFCLDSVRCSDSLWDFEKNCPLSVYPAGQGRDRGVRTFGFLVRRRPAESIFRGVKWASLDNLLESVSSKVQK